jgi:hypothetical protein
MNQRKGMHEFHRRRRRQRRSVFARIRLGKTGLATFKHERGPQSLTTGEQAVLNRIDQPRRGEHVACADFDEVFVQLFSMLPQQLSRSRCRRRGDILSGFHDSVGW